MAPRINYKSRLKNFISNNPELVGEYEALPSALPIEYCFDEIINVWQKLLSIDVTLDANKSLKDAFQNAIHHNINIVDSLDDMTRESINNGGSLNSTQQYFKEINDIYNKHNNDYNIEYCPENRDKLIEMNLKAVISIAKKYQGLGLTLQELISAGN